MKIENVFKGISARLFNVSLDDAIKDPFLGSYNAWDLASGQPSNTNQRQDCVVVRASSGLWHDVLCSKVRIYLQYLQYPDIYTPAPDVQVRVRGRGRGGHRGLQLPRLHRRRDLRRRD